MVANLFRSAIVGSALFSSLAPAISLDVNDHQSIKDAASKTAFGSMGWYGGNDTGGIPGAFPEKWWEGSALFMSLLWYWHYTGDSTYNDQVSQGMEWQAGNGDYMPDNYSSYLGNDDQMFWGQAAMTAAEIKFPDVEDSYSWLSLAQGVFNTQAARWDTMNCGGGLRWQIFPYQAGYNMKNSVSNGGLFMLAARLARYTNNQTYTDWAHKIWDWSTESPLVDKKTWNVADSTDIPDGCTTMGNNQWSYNYGTYLSGAAYLYNMTESDSWKEVVDGLLKVTLRTFFPQKYGGNILVEPCDEKELCNQNEILFKGLVSGWLAFVALLVPSTYDQILPKLQASAEAAAASCTGMNNNTCSVRWYQKKWDGWNGLEEQVIATDVITSLLVMDMPDKAPVTSETGGKSSSDPNAGSGKGGKGGKLPAITAGDKAGASILTILFSGGWIGLVAYMLMGG
ncbi:mannan endo-1,6-alpha-mannosidase [Aspergillus taichungensis]|uniref:Mannan endo-1,6-alpha-mannosidase n=1 Tax=Aspergillus taichungensis TaxID=482145 RepID=A0A2J5HSQ5_9EURO|nr:mannan endo-1,6-alpha-mannosidase [Aspergillus taichungensis]